MAHLYKMSEWNNGGTWYCNDTTEVGTLASKWWIPARMLKISPVEYVRIIAIDYKADVITYNKEKDVLVFGWRNEHYGMMHKFLLWINRESRSRNFII